MGGSCSCLVLPGAACVPRRAAVRCEWEDSWTLRAAFQGISVLSIQLRSAS
jgi:hypothetical protein